MQAIIGETLQNRLVLKWKIPVNFFLLTTFSFLPSHFYWGHCTRIYSFPSPLLISAQLLLSSGTFNGTKETRSNEGIEDGMKGRWNLHTGLPFRKNSNKLKQGTASHSSAPSPEPGSGTAQDGTDASHIRYCWKMFRVLVDEHWTTLNEAETEPGTPAREAVPTASWIKGEAQIRTELCQSLSKGQ